jgi:hypothetical protein
MMVMVAFTVGLVIWISAWAFGIKAFDAFLVTALLTLSAAAVRIAQPHVQRLMRRGTPAPGDGQRA